MRVGVSSKVGLGGGLRVGVSSKVGLGGVLWVGVSSKVGLLYSWRGSVGCNERQNRLAADIFLYHRD